VGRALLGLCVKGHSPRGRTVHLHHPHELTAAAQRLFRLVLTIRVRGCELIVPLGVTARELADPFCKVEPQWRNALDVVDVEDMHATNSRQVLLILDLEDISEAGRRPNQIVVRRREHDTWCDAECLRVERSMDEHVRVELHDVLHVLGQRCGMHEIIDGRGLVECGVVHALVCTMVGMNERRANVQPVVRLKLLLGAR